MRGNAIDEENENVTVTETVNTMATQLTVQIRYVHRSPLCLLSC